LRLISAQEEHTLKLDQLVVSYGGATPALRGISLEVPGGKIVTLLGANGAGKSTTLKAISGLLRPSTGAITFAGDALHTMRTDEIVKAGISHVPEGRQVFPGLSVVENLKMGAYANYQKRTVAGNIERVFALFPVLAERSNQVAGTLSGGEQQMLAIGRGLMIQPKLLMLDEPSLGLAPRVVEGIFRTIQQVNALGTTILLIEQNANLALSICDYVYVLSVGSIVLQGTPQAVKEEGQLLNAYLGGTR
jgi:branched-chain amino acid transport system ATP-binding protein